MKTKSGKREHYVAGNWLRGYFEGNFNSLDEAWSFLSNRYLLSYPSIGGRHISMWVKKRNEFGFDQLILCKQGVTEKNELKRLSVLKRAKSSKHSFL